MWSGPHGPGIIPQDLENGHRVKAKDSFDIRQRKAEPCDHEQQEANGAEVFPSLPSSRRFVSLAKIVLKSHYTLAKSFNQQ
jgi:hypothetical protein